MTACSTRNLEPGFYLTLVFEIGTVVPHIVRDDLAGSLKATFVSTWTVLRIPASGHVFQVKVLLSKLRGVIRCWGTIGPLLMEPAYRRVNRLPEPEHFRDRRTKPVALAETIVLGTPEVVAHVGKAGRHDTLVDPRSLLFGYQPGWQAYLLSRHLNMLEAESEGRFFSWSNEPWEMDSSAHIEISLGPRERGVEQTGFFCPPCSGTRPDPVLR